MNIQDLNSWFKSAEASSKKLFSEQRQNILLQNGFHYHNNSKYQQAVGRSQIQQKTKIRITRNHTYNICRIYKNQMLDANPSVGIYPKNPQEYQDQKAAELNRSVWDDLSDTSKFDDRKQELAQDFIVNGEAAVKIFWDPFKGKPKRIDALDEDGQPIKKTIFTGDIVLERIFGFNLLTDDGADSFDSSKIIGIRKLLPIKSLRKRYKEEEDKLEFINKSSEDDFKIFDGISGSYRDSSNQVEVREYYHRPDHTYPQGYFWIATSTGVLEEGELPQGIFPIQYVGFDSIQTTARSSSLIRQIKPYQIEINRAASQVVEHSIVLGSDKILKQAGSKLSRTNGEGITEITYTGEKPDIISGRNGEQYLNHIQAQITEMYEICGIPQIYAEKPNQGENVYAELFRSMRDEKTMVDYAGKFERFIVQIATTVLDLAKVFLPESRLVPIVGRAEFVNIQEYRSVEDFRYQIKLEPQKESINTVVGKSLQLNQILQYAGQHLDSRAVGVIAREMPFLNGEAIFDDLLLDYDNVKNDILALDRGDIPPIHKYDDHPYLVKKLINRTRKRDFAFLPPVIQENYANRIAEHERYIAEQIASNQTTGDIPIGGGTVGVDFYVPDANGKSKRARIPTQALEWLIEQIKQQQANDQAIDSTDLAAVKNDIQGLLRQSKSIIPSV